MDASHVAVWKWVQKLEGIRLDVEPKRRKVVAIDETKLKDDGRQFYFTYGQP